MDIVYDSIAYLYGYTYMCKQQQYYQIFDNIVVAYTYRYIHGERS